MTTVQIIGLWVVIGGAAANLFLCGFACGWWYGRRE